MGELLSTVIIYIVIMDEANVNENMRDDISNDESNVDLSDQTHLKTEYEEEVDTIEKPKKRKATKKQLESLAKARKRKTELQKQKREDSKHTQQLMSNYVEQVGFNNNLKEQMSNLTRQMEDMNARFNKPVEKKEEEEYDEESDEYETDTDEEEYYEPPKLRRENAQVSYRFV